MYLRPRAGYWSVPMSTSLLGASHPMGRAARGRCARAIGRQARSARVRTRRTLEFPPVGLAGCAQTGAEIASAAGCWLIGPDRPRTEHSKRGARLHRDGRPVHPNRLPAQQLCRRYLLIERVERPVHQLHIHWRPNRRLNFVCPRLPCLLPASGSIVG